jgi:ADP-dependent NAD(P)H-hydrate dehydratase / NAD(P)H-hydrate epimerase
MDHSYWQKQDKDKPLFEDLIWSKPQQKALSGKLLIIGGNLHAIAAPGEAFDAALKQGVGECKVAMPTSTKKFFGTKPPLEIMFVKATHSGSFSLEAYDEIKSFLGWADGVLLAGDFGHNSETTILLEKVSATDKLRTYCGDALDNLISDTELLLQNANNALVLSMAQLQKLVVNMHYARPIKLDMSLMQLVEFLHDFSKILPSHMVIMHTDEIIVASGGQIVSTKTSVPIKHTKIATTAAIWWLQNPSKPLQALTTAIAQT